MSRGLIARITGAASPRRPEHSVALRAAVLGAVMTGALALFAEGAVSAPTAAAVLAALPASYWISHRRRAQDNWWIKIALAFAALVALARFLAQVRGVSSLDEVRFPLADLFLWVQVLHGFDLPARKDLHFSLGSSVALMAVAGSLSQDMRFAGFLLAYSAFALGALVLAHRSEVLEGAAVMMRSRPAPRRSHRWLQLRALTRACAAVVLAGALLFLVIPQPASVNTFALPFALGPGLGDLAGAGIANPGFSGDAPARSSGVSYYGFARSLDLRVRGELSERLVLRVRASAPAMWKGVVFDSYDGARWTGAASAPVPLPGEPPYSYPIEQRSLGPRATVTQTFYVEVEQPSALFAAGQPDRVWYDGGVSVDELGALRTSSTLTPGTVYSVVSSRGAATPVQLRRVRHEAPPEKLRRYLQLPPDLPARVGALARRTTQGARNSYDRVKAVERYLRTRYRYTIDSPVPPEGRDAVDHFLFDARVGFCEQFASAMAVMLRSLGIPARVAAGYAVGRRNPFTGYYDVRGSDAHTWVEVWFPGGLGWYEFDPTFDVPPAEVDVAASVPLIGLLRFLAGKLGALNLHATELLRSLAVLSALATLGATALYARRKFHRRSRRGAGPHPSEAPGAGPVTRAFRRLERALAARGAGPSPVETAREIMGRAADANSAGSRRALQAFEQERYGPEPPSSKDAEEAVAELDRLAAKTAAPRPKGG